MSTSIEELKILPYPNKALYNKIPDDKWSEACQFWREVIVFCGESSDITVLPQNIRVFLESYLSNISDISVENGVERKRYGNTESEQLHLEDEIAWFINRRARQLNFKPGHLLAFVRNFGDDRPVIVRNFLLQVLDENVVSQLIEYFEQKVLENKEINMKLINEICKSLSIVISLGSVASEDIDSGKILEIVSTVYGSMVELKNACKLGQLQLAYTVLVSPILEELDEAKRASKERKAYKRTHVTNLLKNLENDFNDSGLCEELKTDLAIKTPLLTKIREYATYTVIPEESSIMNTLEKIIAENTAEPKEPLLDDQLRHTILEIKEMFPDLEETFIVRGLEQYDNSSEAFIAQYLEGNMTDGKSSIEIPEKQKVIERKNVFDNDAFDRLEMDPNSVHIPQNNPSKITFDDVFRDKISITAIKERILDTEFSDDDEELDDNYDQMGNNGIHMHDDVNEGGVTSKEDLPDQTLVHAEAKLFAVLKSRPEIFKRGKSPQMQELSNDVGLSIEQIIGWKVTLERDPAKMKRLERKYELFQGNKIIQSDKQASNDRVDNKSPGNTDLSGNDKNNNESDINRSSNRGGRGGRGQGPSRPQSKSHNYRAKHADQVRDRQRDKKKSQMGVFKDT